MVVADAAPAIPPRLAEWAEAWAELRGCMVGSPPEAADLLEAHAAHQLLHGTDHCASPYARVEQLAQAAALDDGTSNAWQQVLAAAQGLAATSMTDGETGARILEPAAIDSLDDATAAVYRAANLEPPAPLTAPSLPSLPRAAPIVGTERMMLRLASTIDHVLDGALQAPNGNFDRTVTARGPDRLGLEWLTDDTPPSGTWTAVIRGRKVIACSADGCGAPMRHGGVDHVVDVWTPGELVEAAQQGNVLAVWEAGPPAVPARRWLPERGGGVGRAHLRRLPGRGRCVVHAAAVSYHSSDGRPAHQARNRRRPRRAP